MAGSENDRAIVEEKEGPSSDGSYEHSLIYLWQYKHFMGLTVSISLIAGIILNLNLMRHFRIDYNSSGRGVTMLISFQQA